MYVAIRFRLYTAVVLLTFVVIAALSAAVDPGAATATAPARSPEGPDRLRVAPEGLRTGYSRDLFPHWGDADGDGCNTREEVLLAESASPAQVDPRGCTVVAGDWFSPYDGVSVSSPAELQVDHVVELAEAWDSDAAGWTPDRREAFANDLGEPAALITVTSAANQAKPTTTRRSGGPARTTGATVSPRRSR